MKTRRQVLTELRKAKKKFDIYDQEIAEHAKLRVPMEKFYSVRQKEQITGYIQGLRFVLGELD